jgi:hypothetical protein
MRLDPNGPGYGTAEERHADTLRIGMLIDRMPKKHQGAKLKALRPARADDGGLDGVGEVNTINPAYRLIRS